MAVPAQDLETERMGKWWESFSDPVLTQLLSQAEAQNLSLEQAYHRVVESRAELTMVTGNLRPSGGTFADYNYRKRSPNADPFVGSNGNGFNRYEFGLLSSWELDFFGRIKRTIESANAELKFSETDYDQLRLVLLSDVAASYFRIRWIQEQIHVVNESLVVQAEVTKLVEKRLDAGQAPELDQVEAKAFRHRTLASLPNLEQQLQVEFNRLSVLMGQAPGFETRQLVGIGPLPHVPDIIGAGAPMNLLRFRPDVMRQEQLVAAASANVGIATADLYPRFTLVGTISVQAKSVSNLFETAGLAFNLGPSVSWNILQRRRIFSNIEANKARFDQAVVEYRETVLNAVREVEDAMVQQVGFQAEANEMKTAIELDKVAIELGIQRYTVGNSEYQRVLDSQQQLLRDQQRQLNAQAQSLIQLVGIYKSVGGGWSPVELELCSAGIVSATPPATSKQKSPQDGSNDYRPTLAKRSKTAFDAIPSRNQETKNNENVAAFDWNLPLSDPAHVNENSFATTNGNSIIRMPQHSVAPAQAKPVRYDLWSEN